MKMFTLNRPFRIVGALLLGGIAVVCAPGCDANQQAFAGAMLCGAADGINAHYGQPTDYSVQFLQAVQDSQNAGPTDGQ